jgi:hypothetical protein
MANTCRTCAHYPKGGRSGHVFPCAAPIPDIRGILPVSVTSRHDWQWPPKPSYMEPDDGAGCPVWVKR